MQLLQRLDPFDYAVLPIGDNFTMGPADAAIAAEFLKAKYVIPIHYNTWPLIAQDPEAYKAKVEADGSAKVLIVTPGESIELESNLILMGKTPKQLLWRFLVCRNKKSSLRLKTADFTWWALTGSNR